MKKSAIFLSVFLIFVPLFHSGADLYKPHRIFEIGVDAQLSAANNYAGVADVMKKELVIDLQEIADKMSGKGFSFGIQSRENVFLNLNLSSVFRLGFFAGLETSGNFSISQDLFDLLGSGIAVGDTCSVDVSGYTDVFVDAGFSFQTLIRDFGVRIAPAYYVPLVYIPKTTANGTLSTNEDGKIHGEASADVSIFTAVDMHDFMENGKDINDLDLSAGNILSNGGFDISFGVERNFFRGFNAELFGRIPILPGKMKYKMGTRAWATFDETNILGYLNDKESHEYDSGHDDFEYSSADRKVFRPFRLGLSASYAPFGSWLRLQPMIALAVRDPYSSNAIFYPEYGFDIRLSLFEILIFTIGTAYTNQIFEQKAGFALNCRVLELIAQASLCGTSFQSSFNQNGYGVFVGVRTGF